MDFIFESEWRETVERVSTWAGQPVDLQGILFLIGVQELGRGYKTFKKDEKVALMHVAICTLLEPYGHYAFLGRDDDGWPHFKQEQALPVLKAEQQDRLMREAIMEYFRGSEIIPE